jgi:D-alanyl-D-alanine carboxypeptidase/D-alanyl-D-alanine-endopeptidase (penicillin-binding protein 4)
MILGAESRGAQVGVLVVSLDQGDTLLAVRDADRFIPGSNAKVFPLGTLLFQHGPRARRETIVEARGRANRDDGDSTFALSGDLVLHPTGMPDIVPLGSPGSRGLLDSLAYRLRAGGLASFRGTLWLDRTLFADEPPPAGWAYDDLAYGYGATEGAFMANGNAVLIRAEASGGRVRLSLEPPDVPLRVRDGGITIGPPGSAGYLVPRWAEGRAAVVLRGVVPRDGTVLRNVAMGDPDSAAAVLFLSALRRQGVDVGKVSIRFLMPTAADTGARASADHAREPAPSAAPWDSIAPLAPWDSVSSERYRIVGSLESPTLAHAIAVVAAHSLNAESEALLRLAGGEERGKTRADGIAEVMRWVGAAGIDTFDLSLIDGSGLSPQNLASPRAVVRWLEDLERNPSTQGALRSGLPEPGKAGTLERRFGALPAAAKVNAKTGSLTNVTALSGYVTTREGETLVFSMLTNGARRSVSAMRIAEERLVQFLARVPRERRPPMKPPGVPPR